MMPNREMMGQFQNRCGCERPLPQGCHVEPWVMPERVRCVHEFACHEQPVICPLKTRIITHHVFSPRVYTTCCETHEEVCHKPQEPCCGGF